MKLPAEHHTLFHRPKGRRQGKPSGIGYHILYGGLALEHHTCTMSSQSAYKQFAVIVDVEPHCAVLHVFGDVDLSTVGELREALNESAVDGASLLINLVKCRYLDSSGLAALIQARKVLGTQLTIRVDPKSQVSRVMHLVGFDKLFNVVTELQPRSNDIVFTHAYDPSFVGPAIVPQTLSYDFTARP